MNKYILLTIVLSLITYAATTAIPERVAVEAVSL